METKKMIKEQEAAKKAAVEQKKQPIKKEVVNKKNVHYKDYANYSICGIKVLAKNLTEDPKKVTCKNCMRTKYWKEYILK